VNARVCQKSCANADAKENKEMCLREVQTISGCKLLDHSISFPDSKAAAAALRPGSKGVHHPKVFQSKTVQSWNNPWRTNGSMLQARSSA